MSSKEYISNAEDCIQQYPNARWLDLKDYLERSEEENWVIVDARYMQERKVSMIPSALSIEESFKRLDEFKNSPILFYCTVGCRSGAHAEQLKEDGYKSYNLRGGILAWALDGQPLVTPKGEATNRVHVLLEKWAGSSDKFECVW